MKISRRIPWLLLLLLAVLLSPQASYSQTEEEEGELVPTLSGMRLMPCPPVINAVLPPVEVSTSYECLEQTPAITIAYSQTLPNRKGSELANRAVAYLCQFVGHREVTANRSPLIDAWNRNAGAPVGSYWCASLCYSGFAISAQELGVRNPLLRTASVSQQLRYCKGYGSGCEIIKPNHYGGTELCTGDIGCIKSGKRYGESDIGKIWNGHMYTVREQPEPNIAGTVEGNTSAGGSRNGDRVAFRERTISDAVAFIRVV